MMGSPQQEIEALEAAVQVAQGEIRREGPQHRVKLTQAFYLGNCEVTQKQYQDVMGVNPTRFSFTGDGKDTVKDLDTGEHPVENVSWLDAIDFCNKLSGKERRRPYYVHDAETVVVRGGKGTVYRQRPSGSTRAVPGQPRGGPSAIISRI
jgi:formylglycine-generating enzyme required for sulfatase activity